VRVGPLEPTAQPEPQSPQLRNQSRRLQFLRASAAVSRTSGVPRFASVTPSSGGGGGPQVLLAKHTRPVLQSASLVHPVPSGQSAPVPPAIPATTKPVLATASVITWFLEVPGNGCIDRPGGSRELDRRARCVARPAGAGCCNHNKSQISSGPSVVPSPHTEPVSSSVAEQSALHRVQVACPQGHSVSVVLLPSSQTSLGWFCAPSPQ
jgi:hypothetical protein